MNKDISNLKSFSNPVTAGSNDFRETTPDNSFMGGENTSIGQQDVHNEIMEYLLQSDAEDVDQTMSQSQFGQNLKPTLKV